MKALYIVLAVVLVALIALTIVWFLQRRKRKKQLAAAQAGEPAGPGGDEIDLLIRDAENKLSAAKLETGGRVAHLPVYLLLGDAGSTKTSVMLHSGLEPELVAGQVYQNSNVVPTRTANIWFSRRSLFVEAGGKLASDPAKWQRLVRKLQPRASVVGKGEQPPRAAVVFFDCENFTKQGAQDLAVNIARNLRARLGEISQAMGINLPVYVLFTKMDRLPFFTEYVRNFGNEEATQVLGVTLPMMIRRSEGVYGEEETARLSGNFERLFRSLADGRTEFLARETEAGKLPPTYEFPREFRKIRQAAVQFLVDLCRPSQLTTGPFLRGFYFTGVRPVIINETAPVPAAPAQQAGMGTASGATGIFSVGARAQAPQAAPQVIGTRKVPQWMFLSHLFNDVLLADRAAMSASGSSIKTSFARRLLLASAAVICLLLCLAFTISFFRNRSLEASARDAAQGISSAESTGLNVASLDSLRKLETLRQSLATLVNRRHQGAPWSYRWGLYTGNDLYPEVRRIYFNRFHQLLFAQTQTGIVDFLRGLPATPGPEYNPTYEALKAYLITTSFHDKSTQQFLSPVLMKWWTNNRTVDPDRQQLAQKQFDFYSTELKEANPYSNQNDGPVIEKARKYLAQFAGAERVYAFMLAEAAKTNPPINFNRKYPGSAQYVVDTHEVAGAFTKGGWNFMKDAIKHADRYFSGEQWVLGDQTAANFDLGKLQQDLRTHYNSDFVKEWRAYIKAASVVRYASLKDGSQKLMQLSGNQSPLLELFALASQNTAVDDPAVANVFQPVQTVVPANSTDRFIAPSNQNYMNALVTLQASLDSIASQPGTPNETAAGQTLQNATQAKVTTRQMAQAFRIDSEGHVETNTQTLLEQPITYVEGLLRSLGPAELNGKGKSLCGQFRALTSKYPFNRNATAEVTVAELNSVFRKPDGALWTLYDQSLQKLLTRQGSSYVPNTSSGVTLNPAFVSFFNTAAAFSEALYAGGAQDPHLSYTLKPVPSDGIQNVTVHLDGQTLTYNGGAAAAKQFNWQGGGTHEAKATVKFGSGPDLAWSNNDGVWAIFHFFDKAEHWQPSGSAQTLEWIIRIGKDPVTLPNGKPLTVRFDLDMAGAPPVFQRAYLSRFACVAEVAR
ncbi:MAG TPA: ImcF-related family protein [Bryobacteraceae bacterium]|nr:ImcF-related family protein [Bryobacteraceae bacterium]